jgi:hypothetical protein
MHFSRLIPLLLFPILSAGQQADSAAADLRLAESELAQLQHETFYSRDEQQRLAGNREFMKVWDRIAANPLVVKFPFTSLKDVSVLDSKDGKLRIVTWNIFKNDGTHLYFGYLFVNNEKKVKTGLFRSHVEKEYAHFKLLDRSMLIKNPETHVGTPDKWYGMLYYSLIDCDGFYTLLGYDPNDKLTSRKFIDVLSFKTDGTPIFGKDVFSVERKSPKRLMFEYSSEVSMSLKYDEKRRQIVYSHLASRQPGDLLEGQFQYYGPDGSFDALELGKDRWGNLRWELVEDIDARNERSANDDAAKPDPSKQKPVYSPK